MFMVEQKTTAHEGVPLYVRNGWWELGGNAYNISGLFLKAHLEYNKFNTPKALKLLSASSGVGGGLYDNSMVSKMALPYITIIFLILMLLLYLCVGLFHVYSYINII